MSRSEILIVNDDVLSTHAISEYLAAQNYSSSTATSIEQAWRLLLWNPERFAALIVDRLLEDKSGIELIKRMKTNPQLMYIPVIVQTSEASAEEFIEILSAGAYECFYKPVDKDLLLYALRNALADNSLDREEKKF